MPYRRRADALLSELQEAERELAAVRPGSATAELLRAEVVRMRDEYLALIEAARAHHEPDLPPRPAPEGG